MLGEQKAPQYAIDNGESQYDNHHVDVGILVAGGCVFR